jgi:hypothetical protein
MVHIGTKGRKGQTILCNLGPDVCDNDIKGLVSVIQDNYYYKKKNIVKGEESTNLHKLWV